MITETNCTPTLECPALPRVTLDQAVIDLLESIALQESALSHILCAESQKMKTAMAMKEVDLCKLLEINTGAVSRGFRKDFYPADFLLAKWHELGGDVIITSDSHSTDTLTAYFDEAAEAARKAGFTRVMVLTGHGFEPCEL